MFLSDGQKAFLQKRGRRECRKRDLRGDVGLEESENSRRFRPHRRE